MAAQSDGTNDSLKPELRQHPSDGSSSDAAAFSTPPLFGSTTPPSENADAKQLEHLLADISKQALDAQLSFLDGRQPNQIMVVLGRLQQNLTQVVALVAKDEKVLVAHASVPQPKQYARTFEDLPSFSQRWSLIALLLDVEPQKLSVAAEADNLSQPIDGATLPTTAIPPPPIVVPPPMDDDVMMPPTTSLDKGKRALSRVDTDYSLHSSDFSASADSAPPSLTRSSKLEQLLVVFLTNVCRDANYRDGQGRALHQVLASRRSLVSLPNYTTFKFRIEAFTQAFYEHVQQQVQLDGSEDDFDVREIRAFLRSTRTIARFNDAGYREKSKGSYVWRVDASKDEHEQYTFRSFARMIIPPTQPAYHGTRWDWPVQIWDPHVPAAELNAIFTADNLPPWLAWKESGKLSSSSAAPHLSGTPDAGSASTRFTISAHFADDDGQQSTTSVTVDLDVKSPSMKRASSSRSTRGGEHPSMSSSGGEDAEQGIGAGAAGLNPAATQYMSDQDQRILIRNLMLHQQQKAATMSLNLPPAARRRRHNDE